MKIYKSSMALFAVMSLSACAGMPDMNTAKNAYQNKQYDVAYANYNELAEFGLPQAKVELGKMYLYGRGTDKDPQKALSLFEEAQALGERRYAPRYIPKAQARVGAMALKSDNGVPPAQGVALLQEAAAHGEADALFQLGYAHEKGRGVARNGKLADNYYRQAAAEGNAKAQFYRAELYRKGDIVAKNPATAVQLYRLAGEAGYPRAWQQLGQMYEKGMDVPQDIDKARQYYLLAQEKGILVESDLARPQKREGQAL